ncbi:hypothetical protein K7G98_15040 [Saccharothrix sp. MB29]|nr:hypothetical protein [Saccharothrix sp. MB29]
MGAARDPGLLRRPADEGVTLEVGPTSNLRTGAVPDLAHHPLPRLPDAGCRCARTPTTPPCSTPTSTPSTCWCTSGSTWAGTSRPTWPAPACGPLSRPRGSSGRCRPGSTR